MTMTVTRIPFDRLPAKTPHSRSAPAISSDSTATNRSSPAPSS